MSQRHERGDEEDGLHLDEEEEKRTSETRQHERVDFAISFHDTRSCSVSNAGTRCLASACAQYVICTHSSYISTLADAQRSARRRHPRRLFSRDRHPSAPGEPDGASGPNTAALGPDEFRPGRRASDVERPARFGLIHAEEGPSPPFSVHGRARRGPERDDVGKSPR